MAKEQGTATDLQAYIDIVNHRQEQPCLKLVSTGSINEKGIDKRRWKILVTCLNYEDTGKTQSLWECRKHYYCRQEFFLARKAIRSFEQGIFACKAMDQKTTEQYDDQ